MQEIRPTRRAPYRVRKLISPPARTLQEARQECRLVIRGMTRRNLTPTADGPPQDSLVLTYPPGVGKTRALTDDLNEVLSQLPDAQVLVVAPTHDLLAEIAANLNVSAIHVLGRAEGTCEYPRIATAMNQRRLDMARHVCNRVCPARNGCDYYDQFQTPAKVWLVTPQMARSKRFVYWRTGGCGELKDWSLVAYDDVNPLAAFVEEISVVMGDLLRLAGQPTASEHRLILYELAQLAAANPRPIDGPELWNRLAEGLGGAENLSQLVENIQSATLPREIVPSLSRDRMPTVDEVEFQIPAFVEPLFQTLRDEGLKFVGGEPFNARLSAGNGVVTIRWRDIPRYIDRSPILILDATPDLLAWGHVLGCEVPVAGSEPVAFGQGVEIVQIADYFNGRAALRNPERLQRLLEQLEDIVNSLAPPVVIISFLDLENLLQSRFGEDGVTAGHFWAVRGLNRFQEAQSLIVVGCPTPSMVQIIPRLAALYSSGPVLDTRTVMEEVRYDTPFSVEGWAVQVLRYADPRVTSALTCLREGELLQTIHRLRPLGREDTCTIFLLTEQPVPGIPVHLTGMERVYCPGFDETTQQIVDAVLDAISRSEHEDRDYPETSDVADAAFGVRSSQSRRRVTKGGRLDEVVYHTHDIHITVERETRTRTLRNQGSTTYETWIFRR